LLVYNCSAVKGLRFNQIIYSKFSLWDYKTNMRNSIYMSGFCVAKRQLLSVITKETQFCVKPSYTVQIILSACLKIFLNFHTLVNNKIADFFSLQVTVAYSPLLQLFTDCYAGSGQLSCGVYHSASACGLCV